MCESFLYYLTIHPNSQVGDLRVLEWLLECVAHPEYEVLTYLSIIAFHVNCINLFLFFRWRK